MDIIYNWLVQGVMAVGPFILLLSLLIFVHELGHFLVAKWCGVRVETFSIGFGKKIFKYKKGFTTYCVSLIPLGGYIKMFGDDPNTKIDPKDKHHSFLHKTVGQRIAIVAAGPLMNFFFSILVFMSIGLIGEPVPKAFLGDIAQETEAYELGFRSGDTIISVNSQKINHFDTFKKSIENNPEKMLSVHIKRAPEHSKETPLALLQITPNKIENPSPLDTREFIGDVPGITYLSAKPVFFNSRRSALYPKVKDSIIQIKKVGQHSIKYRREFIPKLKKLLNSHSNQSSIHLEIASVVNPFASKAAKKIAIEKNHSRIIKISKNNFLKNISLANTKTINLKNLGLDTCELCVGYVKPHSPAFNSGIKPEDKIVSINKKPLTKWADLSKNVQKESLKGQPLSIVILRNSDKKTLMISPKKISTKNIDGTTSKKYLIGVAPLLPMHAEFTRNKVTGLWNLFRFGMDESIKWTELTILSVVKVFQQKVSSENIAGVIGIGQMAKSSLELGWVAFLKLMAIISINLFLLNLLPIPVLDGGHLLFYFVEILKGGQPVSLAVREKAQVVGFVLLMGLVFYSLFNDVVRLLH